MNIPTNKKETPQKYMWTMDTAYILNEQQLIWSPFKNETLTFPLPAINSDLENTGTIYIEEPTEEKINTCLLLSKGELKHIFQYTEKDILTSIDGNSELRVMAFTTIHFKKYTGILNFSSYGKNIISITTHLEQNNPFINNSIWAKSLAKLYK